MATSGVDDWGALLLLSIAFSPFARPKNLWATVIINTRRQGLASLLEDYHSARWLRASTPDRLAN